ncbi:MAG: protein BatD, partial [Clostridiaceae bacterium]|nr:protein BatD [Clostridiaceae bacterium]
MIGKKLKAKALFSLIIFLISIFSIQGSVLAEEPEFRLEIDSLKIGSGESTNLAVSMINAKEAEIVSIEGIENFDIISSGNSMSTQVINGDMTYKKDRNYVIMPKQTGQFTLTANIKYNGQTYRTNSLQVNVTEEKNSQEGGEAKDLFIKTILSDTNIYFGQKAVLSYELYTRYNIENFGFLDNTDINGFIKKEVPQGNLKSGFVNIDNKRYAKYEVKQTFLTPTKTGKFTIPSYNFQVNVSTGGFFDSSKPFYLKTEQKELEVRELPLTNQPPDFSGLVGKLNVDAKYSKQEIDIKDSISLNVTLSGDCDLAGIKKIIKEDISGFSVYETEKNTQESIEEGRFSAKKEFEIVLVPEKNGDIKIAPIYISYFNPESGNYEKAEIPGTTIMVSGNMPEIQSAAGNTSSSIPAEVQTVKIDQVSYDSEGEGYFTIKLKKEYLLTGFVVLAIV